MENNKQNCIYLQMTMMSEENQQIYQKQKTRTSKLMQNQCTKNQLYLYVLTTINLKAKLSF